MAKKKFVPKKPKYNVFIIATKVLALQVVNYPDYKYKVVLDCESSTGKPRRCIYWHYGKPLGVQVGDKVLLTGRIDGDVFLVYKLLYKPKNRTDDNSEEIKNERTG